MSGIYIKGMEMPKNCFLCQLSYLRDNRLFCYVTKDEVVRAKIASECPMVFVPDHGRLIDADALNSSETDYLGNHLVYLVDIDDAPTIIPAEEAQSDS